MEKIVSKIAGYLKKHYSLPEQEALTMIYGEWELVEEILNLNENEKDAIKEIAQILTEIYMVA